MLEHLAAALVGVLITGVLIAVLLVVGMRNPLALWDRLRARHPDRTIHLVGRNPPFRRSFEHLTGQRLPLSFSRYYLGAVVVDRTLEVWQLRGGGLERIAVFDQHQPVEVKRAVSQQGNGRFETINVQVDVGDRTGWLWLLLAEASRPWWIRLTPPDGRDAFVREWEDASEPAQL